ncbi:hypothetical protein [Vibrio phage 5 TSL-2019]|uniref:Uncharacterized protein n=2 Tax=Aphroditevirus USC1 TaxID=2846605 RepID=A0A513SPV4_9CAUD|nr:hypothetical protein [Vibrio phage 5 TSL-2019]
MTDFTGMTQAELLHAFFYTAYENTVSFGRQAAVEQAIAGMFTNLLRSIVIIEKFEDFPWLIIQNEITAICIQMVEDIDDILSGNELIAYNPLPNVEYPKAMMLEIVHEC